MARGHRRWQFGFFLTLIGVLCGPLVVAHTPTVDANLQDWCLGAASNGPGLGRVEDSFAVLTCGNCSVATNRACRVNSDCAAGQTCVNTTSKSEMVWWDNRTDGAVNDLGTVAFTQDNTNLYVSAELWVDPDPVSLPFAEIAIDVIPGGISTWHDPNMVLTRPGNCSAFTDRACTSDADCHFCMISTEPFPSTRVRTCGSACDPDIGDVCNMSQTCENLGVGGLTQSIGLNSSPVSAPDYLLVFDFSRWLVGLTDATQVMKAVGGTWTPQAVFMPAVNPGASGGSGGPPGSIEIAIPWTAFGCTGCPGACVCPDLGPGVDFQFTILVARGTLTLDYAPDGAIEDLMSEPVGGSTTTSPNDCAGFGIGNTFCELSDGSIDSFAPTVAAVAGGRTSGLTMDRGAGASVTLMWGPSCSSADTDYEVYEGELGSWYSHSPVTGLCTTGGATRATFDAATGTRYYLIVPTNLSTEGSYGEDSSGSERPAGTTPCRAQSLGTCP